MTIKKNSNFEDMQLYTNTFLDQYDDKYIEQFSEEYNATYEEYEAKHYVDNDGTLYVFSSYNPESQINKIQVVEGSVPQKDNDIFLTEGYAKSMGVEVGDSILIDGNEFIVSGYGYIPIYTLPLDFATLEFPGATYMPAYIYNTTFDKIKVAPEAYFKSYLIDLEEDLSDDEVQKIANEVMSQYLVEVPLLDVHGNMQFDDNGNIIMHKVPAFLKAVPAYAHQNLEAMQQIIPAFRKLLGTFASVIIILVLVMAIVLFNALFKEQRREIGILRAEGFEKNILALQYTKILFIFLIIFGMIGVVIGTIITKVFILILTSIYNLPVLPTPLHLRVIVLIIVIVLALLLTILVYIFAIRRNLKVSPLLLIRNLDKNQIPKFKFVDRFTRIPFSIRIKANIMLRNISVIIILFVGVFVVSLLLLLVQIMGSSVLTMLHNEYININYDYKITYAQNVKGSENIDSYLSFGTTIKSVEEEYKNTQVMAFDKDNTNITLYDIGGNAITQSDYEDGIVISYYMASKLNVAIGDEITLVNPFVVDESVTLVINNITSNITDSIVYADLDFIQATFNIDSNYVSGIYINEDDLDAFIVEYPTAIVTSLDTANNSTQKMNKLLYFVVSIISIIAIIVAIVSMSLITIISINNNKKAILIMRTFGYTTRETWKITNSINKWVIFVSFLITLPFIWLVITNIIGFAFDKLGITIIFQFHLINAIITITLIYFIYYIVSKITRKKIDHVNLAIELKNDE